MDDPPFINPPPPKPAIPTNLRLQEGRERFGEPDPVLDAMRSRIKERMEDPPPRRCHAPRPNSPVSLAIVFTAGICIVGTMVVLLIRQEHQERVEAQDGMRRAMAYQEVYLDQAQAAEKRATKAEHRAEYLEELLKKHLGLTPNLESLK